MSSTGVPKDLPKAPRSTPEQGISAQALASKIDAFLTSRGYRAPDAAAGATSPDSGKTAVPPAVSASAPATAAPANQEPEEFICEDDVRGAIRAGRKLVVGEKTIITPSARDLGEAQKVFVQAGWPR